MAGGQDEFKFGRSTPGSAGRSAPLTSCGQDEFKFGRSTPRFWLADLSPVFRGAEHQVANLADLPSDLPADVPPYSHLVAKNGNFRFLLSQSHISRLTGRSIPSTDILWSR